jgi:STE24 endopeptidase
MNAFLFAILAILVGHYLLHVVEEMLNIRHMSPVLPPEFTGVYDAERYRLAQSYLRDTTRFDLVAATVFMPLTAGFILVGGFNMVDQWARGFGHGPIVTGLVFAASVGLVSFLIHIPFSAYRTFVIEERYGFNRTTVRTFLLDLLKAVILGALIGGAVLAAVLWFFAWAGRLAWLYCWGAVSVFELFLAFVAPVVIMPLFNKFTPLEEGDLRRSIEDYAQAQRFRMKGVFKMDGSRRSTKTNAFFTGFGKYRRIVLFDTLIAKHTVNELTAVLAHEMGHYKLKHVLKHVVLALLTNGIMFYLLSLLIESRGLSRALGMSDYALYSNLVFFLFLYAPLATALGVVMNAISRRHEYAADAYAAVTSGKPDAMIDALKKLSRDNLSNLTPHPLKVFLSYTHPPVLDRVRALRTTV